MTMDNLKKKFLSFLLVTTLIASPLSAFASNMFEEQMLSHKEPPDPVVMILDFTLVRPLGLVATVGGSAFFIVSSPFSILGGNIEDAWESLVVSPAAFTFIRPLGEFD